MAFFDVSLETANAFYEWGWKISLFGAVATAVGVGLLMWGTRARDHDFEKQIADLHLAAGRSEERASILESEAAQTREKAAALEVTAEQLRVKIAEANKQVAIAQQRAAEAQLSLEKFRAPRLPTPEQLALITERLKPFVGTKFDTGLSGADREEEDFLWRLEPAITEAGWLEVDWVGPERFARAGRPTSGRAIVIGVSIEIHPGKRNEFLPAAEALASALNDIGIVASAGTFNVHNDNPNAIHVLIGRKP